MNTSLEYAKMCQEAKEVQELRECSKEDYPDKAKYQLGDFYFIPKHKKIFIQDENEDNPPPMFSPVWLPRQDQLQVLVPFKWHEEFWQAMNDFEFPRWVVEEDMKTRFDSQSYEMLWLAFVMYTSHKKIWHRFKEVWIQK